MQRYRLLGYESRRQSGTLTAPQDVLNNEGVVLGLVFGGVLGLLLA